MSTDLTTIETSALTVANPSSLDRNPAAVYLAGLGKGSRPTMLDALKTIATILTSGEHADPFAISWAALRFQHTTAIRSQLAERYSAATTNKILCALRGVLKAAWQLGQLSAEDYHRAIDLKSVTGSTLPAGRALTSGEIAALLEVCYQDHTHAGRRDAAMLALLRAGGLRRAEICALELADLNEQDGSLIIRGKRNKQRMIYVSNGSAEALADWLKVRGDEPGAMFCPVLKGDRISVRHMAPEGVYAMLQKRANQAGVKDLSPHDMRRTFVSDLLDAGADIATVQKLAGHSSVNTTSRYDRRPEETKRKAQELICVPYHPISR